MGPSDGAAWYERIPPPVWFFACLGAGWGLNRAVPLPIPFPAFGWQLGPALALFALAAGVSAWSIGLFRLRRTTVLPFGVATTLLTTGPYRFSRNPLYVATVATLAAFGLLLGTVWVLLATALLFLTLDRFVIPGEEAVLARVFGDHYATYRGRVRRWL
ncbi:MAG TPA: methyltransferase [Thermoanaerobaculia bacterium]|nr:methyltransferase [Thermoanaerobaculia bacterium]HQR66603.1 methyltransferase [Thermoanaerobaculia bacterium]